MICLAFDTAIRTGVAVGAACGKPKSFTVGLGSVSWEMRYARMLRLVERCVGEFSPHLVVVEAPAAGGFQNLDLIGLTVCVRAQAARMGVRSAAYYPNSIRKHFMGRALSARDFPGKSHGARKAAIKGQIIARCQMLGWDVKDADAADACALWDYALALESRAHQVACGPGMLGGKA